MSPRRAILIGSSGQVARSLHALLRARNFEVTATSSSGVAGAAKLDLGDAESIRAFFRGAEELFGRGGVEVFLPGALTHVDKCEKERELCERVNHRGPALVAEECRRLDYFLTFFSTEYVFGGAEYEGGAVGPFSEDDPPHPTSWYGECKLRAERDILATLGEVRAMIVRTTMVFSWDEKGMNFLMQYIRHLEQRGRGATAAVFRIPEDQISTPTYAPNLAENVLLLRDKGFGGVINIVGADCLSRREIVERVIAAFGFDRIPSLSGFEFLRTQELGQAAKRPLTAGLRSEKARSLGCEVLTLEEAFRRAKEMKKGARV
jgi:dTDP-4-dehydrorhamnose reductase